jgi:hypothetical protein
VADTVGPADAAADAAVHDPHNIRSSLRKAPIPFYWNTETGYVDNPKYIKHVEASISMVGVHKHCDACAKPPQGSLQCRFGMPQQCIPCTQPVQLKEVQSSDEDVDQRENRIRPSRCKHPYEVLPITAIDTLPDFEYMMYGEDEESPFSPAQREDQCQRQGGVFQSIDNWMPWLQYCFLQNQ